MEAAMRFSSRQTVLLFGIINLLLPNVAFANNSSMYPRDFANQPCDLSNGKEGVCVYGYLCLDNIINVDGNGIIDLRFSDVCEDYFLKCCSKETPCLENTGTCVSASDCAANLNDPKNKKFKQTDECDWSGYKCCPNEIILQSEVSNQDDRESCDSDSFCVPYDQCTVNPDGDGLLDPRLSDCSSRGHTCCPETMIKAPGLENILAPVSSDVQTNSIEQYETCDDCSVCVPDDQCLVKPDGDNIIQGRVSTCSGWNQTCCPKDKVKGGDPCNEVGGACIPEKSCPASSSLILDVRISQCDEFGYVCCMQGVNGRNQFINKTCSGGNGKCTPRKQCRGTTYRDRNNDCGGLACCATVTTTTTLPSVSTSTTRKPGGNENDGKACFRNLGKCTSRSCVGPKYTDRKNECGGLNCCAPYDMLTTPETVFTPTTSKSVDGSSITKKDGKACAENRGKCTSGICEGSKYRDRKNECGGLICCVPSDMLTTPKTVFTPTTSKSVDRGSSVTESDTELDTDSDSAPARSCYSIGGKCKQVESCVNKSNLPVDDCTSNEVCCVQEVYGLIKDCGYRNENGVRFGITGHEHGESQFGEFPWMVAIMVKENGNDRFTCGGSLIDPEVVLTSAECVKSFKRTPDVLIVRAGEWDMGTTSEPILHEERQVTKIKSHPNFKATTLVNNIALLFLNDKFDLSATINTVCLPPQNFVIDNGDVTASGWGTTPQDRTKNQQILKSIDLQYIDRSECERVLRRGTKNHSFKLHRSFICAGGVAGLDTCKGDAGSPIMYPVPNDFDSRYYAVGMVSWGIGCGRAGVPAAYTDLAFFRDWIDEEMDLEGLHAHYYTYSRQEEEEEVEDNQKY